MIHHRTTYISTGKIQSDVNYITKNKQNLGQNGGASKNMMWVGLIVEIFKKAMMFIGYFSFLSIVFILGCIIRCTIVDGFNSISEENRRNFKGLIIMVLIIALIGAIMLTFFKNP